LTRGRLTFRLCKKIFQGSQVTRTADKKKNSCQTIFSKKQISLKIKQQERRPRKGWLGRDRAVFATPSRVLSKEKKCKRNQKKISHLN
jgi:hypothetical protein